MLIFSGIHNKLDAVKFFEKYYTYIIQNKRHYKTISIGDSQNDIEMLNYCDYSGIVNKR